VAGPELARNAHRGGHVRATGAAKEQAFLVQQAVGRTHDLGILDPHGVVAKIQRISLEDETWFRVRIGPIETVEDFDRVRSKLAEADIEAAPVVPVAEQPPP
jgi:hypothetical protein